MAAKIWPGTRALAQMHLDAGQRVWLVTATPVEVATVIARRLGLTGALGTVAETEDGVYTGRLVGEILHGQAKARGGHARWPSGRGWTSAPARRTPTPPTTSRCCPWSGTRARSTRTAGCARTPGSTAGGSRDYRTGRKAVKVGVPTAAAAGALAGAVAAAASVRRRGR